MYEPEAKATRHWGKCPACGQANTMLDYGREIYCQACDKWFPKEKAKSEEEKDNDREV